MLSQVLDKRVLIITRKTLATNAYMYFVILLSFFIKLISYSPLLQDGWLVFLFLFFTGESFFPETCTKDHNIIRKKECAGKSPYYGISPVIQDLMILRKNAECRDSQRLIMPPLYVM